MGWKRAVKGKKKIKKSFHGTQSLLDIQDGERNQSEVSLRFAALDSHCLRFTFISGGGQPGQFLQTDKALIPWDNQASLRLTCIQCQNISFSTKI